MRTERIIVDPSMMSGKPCLSGLRVTVENVLRQLASERSTEEILGAYPYLESEDIDACLTFAADHTDDEELILTAT